MAPNEYSVSNSIVVQAPPHDVFEVLADPRKHPIIDGSGTVREGISGPERLQLDSRFGMQMRIVVGYHITNTVVEFEENRLIAWRHTAPARWRYELEPVGEAATRVTETFDYSRMPLPKLVALLGLPKRNQRGIDATLERLKAYVENGEAE
jgi:hypothetical protein